MLTFRVQWMLPTLAAIGFGCGQPIAAVTPTDAPARPADGAPSYQVDAAAGNQLESAPTYSVLAVPSPGNRGGNKPGNDKWRGGGNRHDSGHLFA